MKKYISIICLLFLSLLSVVAKEYTAKDIPMIHLQDARKYVCDPDGIMDNAAKDSADFYLQKLDKECGIQTVFVIVNNVANGDVFRVAEDIGNEQGVGNRKTNRGLVVVISVNDRKYFIAPGEGLEKDLTDLECNNIGQECIVTNMRNDNPDEAVFSTVKAVYNKFKTGSTGLEQPSDDEDSGLIGSLVLLAICGFYIYYATRKNNNNNKGGNGGRRNRNNIFWGPIIWGNPGHINDSGFGGGSFGGGSFGGGSFGGGGAGGGW